MKLTDATIRALSHPENGQRYYGDNAVPGLAICVGKRTKTFTLVTRDRVRHTLGRYDPPRFTLALAREAARDLIARERLAQSQPARVTFQEAWDTYGKTYLPTLRPQSRRCIVKPIERRFLPKLGRVPLEAISRRDIAPILDTMLTTPAAMRSTFSYLRAFLSWCVKRGYLETAPTDRMEEPRAGTSRSRVLSHEELIAVWAACPADDYGRIVKLCLLSGQRRHQWAAVRREYIQGEVVVFPAAVMKSKKAHTLPLTPTMKALLPDRIGYLFANTSGVPFDNWSRCKERLDEASGVIAWTLHDLRRSWATVAAEELDIEPHHIESVLAHSIGTAIARTYNRATYVEPMRKALLAFEEWLHALLSKWEGTDADQRRIRGNADVRNETA